MGNGEKRKRDRCQACGDGSPVPTHWNWNGSAGSFSFILEFALSVRKWGSPPVHVTFIVYNGIMVRVDVTY